MSRALLVTHPGGEHVPRRRDGRGEVHYPWNTASHRRKFLLARATLAEPDGSTYRGSENMRDVALWGEWEPPSTAVRFPSAAGPLFPTAWHKPLVDGQPWSAPPTSAQNTDPWIFGDVMRYSNCRQLRNPILRELDPRDVVFFGSLKKRDCSGVRTARFGFMLDTVFVVGKAAGHPDPMDESDSLFRRAVLERLSSDVRSKSRLYEGRMLDEEGSEEPFSWVPCRPLSSGDPASARFARPMIHEALRLPDLGNNSRLSHVELSLGAEEAWSRVVAYCMNQCRLSMAVSVEPLQQR